jgi:hypothetical protein
MFDSKHLHPTIVGSATTLTSFPPRTGSTADEAHWVDAATGWVRR